MKTTLMLATMITAAAAFSQTTIPDGTRIRIRLEQDLSSETAEPGQSVDLAVAAEVHVGDAVVIANGSRATGSVLVAQRKRSFGREGRLDFSIERVQLVDGSWLNVRYTPRKIQGKDDGVATGIVRAAFRPIPAFFPPGSGCVFNLRGDVTIVKGRTYDVFADDTWPTPAQ